MSDQLLRLDGDTLTINVKGWRASAASEMLIRANELLSNISGVGLVRVYGVCTVPLSSIITDWAKDENVLLAFYIAGENNFTVTSRGPRLGQVLDGFPLDSVGKAILPD